MNLFIVEDDKEILDFLKPSLKAEGFVVGIIEDGEIEQHSNVHDSLSYQSENDIPSKVKMTSPLSQYH